MTVKLSQIANTALVLKHPLYYLVSLHVFRFEALHKTSCQFILVSFTCRAHVIAKYLLISELVPTTYCFCLSLTYLSSFPVKLLWLSATLPIIGTLDGKYSGKTFCSDNVIRKSNYTAKQSNNTVFP